MVTMKLCPWLALILTTSGRTIKTRRVKIGIAFLVVIRV